MFKVGNIDKLLFDDKKFTKSKLYFWAYQSLEMVQNELKAIIRQWESYRAEADIFSSKKGQTTRRKESDRKREDFAKMSDDWMSKFAGLIEDCKAKQHEITALRDGVRIQPVPRNP